VVRHGVLRLHFDDGLTGDVDVLGRMRGPVFEQARTPEGFGEVKAHPGTGTVVWPGGADLAPDTLYERVPTGAWPDQGPRCIADPARAPHHPLPATGSRPYRLGISR
jgi:hypothetical protein